MWWARGFDRQTEELRAEIGVPSIPLATVRALWGLSPSDLGYDAYPITAERLPVLAPYLSDIPLELDRFDYFLEFDVEIASDASDEPVFQNGHADEGALAAPFAR